MATSRALLRHAGYGAAEALLRSLSGTCDGARGHVPGRTVVNQPPKCTPTMRTPANVLS